MTRSSHWPEQIRGRDFPGWDCCLCYQCRQTDFETSDVPCSEQQICPWETGARMAAAVQTGPLEADSHDSGWPGLQTCF